MKTGKQACWKRREQFEVVRGMLNQHELVKLSTSKDAVVSVKKLKVVNPTAATVTTCHKQQTCRRSDGTEED